MPSRHLETTPPIRGKPPTTSSEDKIGPFILPSPFLYGNLAHYKRGAEDIWALEIFEGDRMGPDLAQMLYDRVKSTFYAPEKLHFKPASSEQEKMIPELKARGIPVLTNGDLYGDRTFVVLHSGKATGRLHIVRKLERNTELFFDRREIVLLGVLPNDITPVAGVLTTSLSTPLSHVNLRATAWNIPNATWKTAVQYADAQQLEGKVVVLDIQSDMDQPVLRLATPKEIEEWEHADNERPRVSPEVDLAPKELRDLADLKAYRRRDEQGRPRGDGSSYGTKSANLGEVLSLARELSVGDIRPLMAGDMRLLFSIVAPDPTLPVKLQRVTSSERARLLTRNHLVVPDGFGLPISAYQAFVDDPANAAIKAKIDGMRTDPKFKSDPYYRKAYLAEVRGMVRNGRFPPAYEALLREKLSKPPYARAGLFVRSSTNAEDLPGFNGAGLYDTVPNVQGPDNVLKAVLQVWGSIWNFNAYEEREFYGMKHEQVYPGVLIMVGVNADGAGVLITRNPFDAADQNRVYINARRGLGIGVVDGQHIPEQILLDSFNLNLTRISHASGGTIIVFDPDGGVHEVPLPEGGVVVDEAKVRLLAYLSRIVEAHFTTIFQKATPQDMEWLIKDGKVYVVQSRPYLTGK
jgi:hypothetical protein